MPEFDPQLADTVTLPGGYRVSLKGRKNPLSSFLEEVPGFPTSPQLTTPPFVGDRSVAEMAASPEAVPRRRDTAAVPPSLAADMEAPTRMTPPSAEPIRPRGDTAGVVPPSLARDLEAPSPMTPPGQPPAPTTPSLSTDMDQAFQARMAASDARLNQLGQQLGQVGQESTKGKLLRALATFGPVALAGALGGT